MRKLIQKIRDYRDRKFLERMERANAYKERNNTNTRDWQQDARASIYRDANGAYVVEADKGIFKRSL